ncbi:MAG: hypothetical protein HKL96_05435 [Phycisphaerales bacterium]|nr:hypothetical protein [Phycisphaerales bacterium]
MNDEHKPSPHDHHNQAISTSGGLAAVAKYRWPFWLFAGAIALLLLTLQLLQLPRIAGWTLFSFYDPGTALKGDLLISMGMKPAIDFGYTHGLASLLAAHWGFALLGRTPMAFLLMTAIMEVFMAVAVARFAQAMQLSKPALWFLFAALPVAVMPSYLTLTHPLEAMFLLWAIAEQACGRRERALALCTACLFIKPSMAYVYGLLLIIWTIADWSRHERNLPGLWRRTELAIVTGLVMAVAMIWRFGIRSLLLTIIPITGMRTYTDTRFGFFSRSGLRFWWPAHHNWLYFVATPAGIWLLMSVILLWVLVIRGLSHKSDRPVASGTIRVGGLLADWVHTRSCWTETAISIAIMHIAFVLGFYGWKYSWEYYSYLPVLFTALVISRCQARQVQLAAVLGLLAVSSQARSASLMLWCWHDKVRTRETGYLWAYPQQYAQWQDVCKRVKGHRTLILTNGYLPWMPKGMSMPLSWFPEPGIPTAIEMRRLKHEALAAHYIVVRRDYDKSGLWANPAFAPVRQRFNRLWHGQYFSIWRARHKNSSR